MTKRNLSPYEREFIRDTERVFTLSNILQVLPIFVAIGFLQTSPSTRASLLQTLPFINDDLDGLGGFFLSYLVVFAYLMLIGLLQIAFYVSLKPFQKVLVAWIAWGWFFYATLAERSLTLAFVGLFILSLLAARCVGWIIFCYRKVRSGMFFNSRNET